MNENYGNKNFPWPGNTPQRISPTLPNLLDTGGGYQAPVFRAGDFRANAFDPNNQDYKNWLNQGGKFQIGPQYSDSGEKLYDVLQHNEENQRKYLEASGKFVPGLAFSDDFLNRRRHEFGDFAGGFTNQDNLEVLKGTLGSDNFTVRYKGANKSGNVVDYQRQGDSWVPQYLGKHKWDTNTLGTDLLKGAGMVAGVMGAGVGLAGLTGATGLSGLGSAASALKAGNAALGLTNAVVNKNPLAALAAVAPMAGGTLGTALNYGAKGLSTLNNIKSGNYLGALSSAASLSGNSGIQNLGRIAGLGSTVNKMFNPPTPARQPMQRPPQMGMANLQQMQQLQTLYRLAQLQRLAQQRKKP